MGDTPRLSISRYLDRPRSYRDLIWGAIIAAAALSGFLALNLYNDLLFHVAVELIAICVAASIFLVAWNTRALVQDAYLPFLGAAFMCIAALDLAHTLSYQGMGLLPEGGGNTSAQLWIQARYLQALAFLIAPSFLRRGAKSVLEWTLVGFGSIVVLLILSVFVRPFFPTCYIDGQGVTTFKTASEFVISALFLLALVRLFRSRNLFDRKVFWWLGASIAVAVASELLFASFASDYGMSHVGGHLLKVVSLYLVYRAIIKTSLQEPHALLLRELHQNEQRFRTLFETSPLPINMTDGNGRIVQANPAFRRLLGFTEGELRGLSFRDVTHPDDREANTRLFAEALSGELSEYRIKKRYLHKSGVAVPVDVAVSVVLDPAGALKYAFAISRDLTEQREHERQLEALARRDPLTGVYNRYALRQIIEQEVKRSVRYEHPIGILMIDVNRFKEINDRFGHTTGDRVLKAVAEVLLNSVRDTDIVVRYGGDEFLAVLLETNGETSTVASRIRAEVTERNRTHPLLEFDVTLAIGEAHWDVDHGETIETVIAQADRRMYADKAKINGSRPS